MYTNLAYLSEKNDYSQPLTVKSCGHYKIYSHPHAVSNRPSGRSDYQLVYTAAGRTHFNINGTEHTLAAGDVVLYRPGEPQHYSYYAKDKPEIFWVHFSGSGVEKILENCHLTSQNIFHIGVQPEMNNLFTRIIDEIQKQKNGFRRITTLLLENILLLTSRHKLQSNDEPVQEEQKATPLSNIQHEITMAVSYFNEHYMEAISIEDYAKSRNMSSCWFIRNFKKWIGVTPTQHIISARIASAQSLLENTDYNVTQIATLVGYDDPMYFSRTFRKKVGISPSEWRKKCY